MRHLLLLFGLLLSTTLTFASVIKGEDEINVESPATGNHYLAGRQITIGAPIIGDMIGAGETIYIRDTIHNDLWLGGSNLFITAPILDDVRIAGGKIELNAVVQGDLFVAGGEIFINESAIINGDILIAGGQVTIKGTLNGTLKIAAGDVQFEGTAIQAASFKTGKLLINGTLRQGATIAGEQIELGPDAAFYGPVRYWREAGELDFSPYLKDGATATYDESLKVSVGEDDWKNLGFSALAFLAFQLLAGILLLLLIGSIFNEGMQRAGHLATDQAGRSILIGLLFFVGLPVFMGVAFLTVIGIPLGFLALFGWSSGLILANSLTALVGAYFLQDYLRKDWTKGTVMLVAIGLFVGLLLIGKLPIVGWIATAVACFWGLGATLLAIFRKTPDNAELA